VKHHWCKALLLAALLSPPPAFARTQDSRVTLVAPATFKAPAQDATESSFLQDQVARMIQTRFEMLDRLAPQPLSDCADRSQITRRLDALQELDTFTRTTIDGLINAAPTYEMRLKADENLAPVLAQHEEIIAAALKRLHNLSLVQSESAEITSSLKGRIQAKLKELGQRGQTASTPVDQAPANSPAL
jgi:hypothetical protein